MNSSNWIALGGLCISIVSFLWSWSTRRKLNQQQKQINASTIKKNQEESIAKSKALIQAKAVSKPKMWAISIRNTGLATAKNITISSTDIDRENSGIIMLKEEGVLPYLLLHPNEEFEISVLLHSGHIPAPKITLLWDDDFGKDNQREQILQF